MRKLFTLTLILISTLSGLHAQLADGSIAPDFTAIDINGNEWNLYEILDQGKSVVLDVSATWCGPCWNYHQSGALEELYEAHGPNGTDDFVVFMIEGDANTNTNCLYGEDGCNSSTYGDWTEGVEYPIVDDASIAELYQISYYPTIYQICPNRLVREVGQISADEIYLTHDECAVASGLNNAAILSYEGFEGSFCQEVTFIPEIKVQNLGTDLLSSVTVELYIDGNLSETIEWMGSLNTYQIENIKMGEIYTSQDTDIEIAITQTNGTSDDDMDNNVTNAFLRYALQASDNILALEIFTDNYPGETSWELVDSEGRTFYQGGGYTNAMTSYKEELSLPGDGCFEFSIYDSYGDGLTDVGGYYVIKDSNGNIVIEGGDFETADITPFEILGANSIAANGAIVDYSGESGYVCGQYSYNPSITVQNLGADPITSMKIETEVNGEVVSTYDWLGDIETGSSQIIVLDEIDIIEAIALTFSIVEINGVNDNYDYLNQFSTSFDRLVTDETLWTLELQLDSYAEEIYWQITNSAGEIIVKGGNEDVGPDGGGTGLADPTSPGAYSSGALINELIILPEDQNDCYDFLLVDSYGDGVVDGGGGFIKLTGALGDIIIDQNLDTYRFSTEKYVINVEGVSSVEELEGVSDLMVNPNPSSGFLQINFELTESKEIHLGVYDALGRLIKTINKNEFNAGLNVIEAEMNLLSNGIYSIRLSDGKKVLSEKFTIIK